MKLSIWVVPLLLISSAFAYIPPSQFIIKTMASKRRGVRLVRIVSEVSGFDSGKPTGQRFKSVTVYNPLTHVMRSQALDDTGVELFGVEKTGESLPLSLTVLYDANSQVISGALKRSDIPIRPEEETPSNVGTKTDDEQTALRRWNGSVAWVFGLGSMQKDSAQFWVEKDTFLPVRLLVGDQDIQFTKYRYSQELPYPRSTSLATRAGAIVLEEDVGEVQVNPPVSVERAAIAAGYTDAGNLSPSKELIRKFYAGLR